MIFALFLHMMTIIIALEKPEQSSVQKSGSLVRVEGSEYPDN
jgi:hypothetical protein